MRNITAVKVVLRNNNNKKTLKVNGGVEETAKAEKKIHRLELRIIE